MLRRARLVLAALSASVAVVACAVFSGGADEGVAIEPEGSAPDAAASPLVDGSASPEQPAPDADAAASPCEKPEVVAVQAVADVPLYPGAPGFGHCFGPLNPGAAGHAILHASWSFNADPGSPSSAIFRFRLPAAALAALRSVPASVRALELELTRYPRCGGQPCTYVAEGKLEAYPVRLDWQEASNGADYCRRSPGGTTLGDPASWQLGGATGPNDTGDRAGLADVDGGQATVTIALDPAEWVPKWLGDGGADNFAVRVAAANGVQFIAAMREADDDAGADAKPTLRITYCKAR